MARARPFAPALLALLLGVAPGLAQTIPADPVLEEQRQKALENRTNALGTMQIRGGAADPGPAQAAAGPCFPIQTVTVDGASLLSAAELHAIVDPFVPRCMQGADIQALMRALDAAYADRGYITSKTYIPAQNLQSGTLTLTMLEGRVEDILLIDTEKQLEGRRADRQIASAFPRTRGDLFRLRDFEQGLDQMNRLASVDAVLKLQPGDQPGGSHVIVQRVQTDRVRGYTRMDNQGSESTGVRKLSFDLQVDDLVGMNDAWTFGYAGSDNTNALTLDASAPWGYWTFGGALSYSEYLTPLNAATELYGTARSIALTAKSMAFRDQTSTTEIALGLTVRRADRFVNDVRLTPQNLSTLSIGVTRMELGAFGRNAYDARLTFGTTLFGADEDLTGLPNNVPRAQFMKLDLGWQRQGAIGRIGTLVTDLRAQYSAVPLYGAEQMSLGSLSTVRGYDAIVASGDNGAYIRNDLYLPPGLWSFLPDAAATHMAEKLQTLVFLDAGVTFDRARNLRETAAGAGVGLSYYHDHFTLSGVVGLPLVTGPTAPRGKPVAQLRVDVKTW